MTKTLGSGRGTTKLIRMSQRQYDLIEQLRSMREHKEISLMSAEMYLADQYAKGLFTARGGEPNVTLEQVARAYRLGELTVYICEPEGK